MTQEKVVSVKSGWTMFTVGVGLVIAGVWCLIQAGMRESGWFGGSGVISILMSIFVFKGFFTLEPNQSAILLLFGSYIGTAKESGFRWVNPLINKHKVSLRANNLNGEKLKVNDKTGNPVEIAAIVVWHVEDTAKAIFDVDDYKKYITLQLEAATRHLASSYPYDSEEGVTSLRGSINEVSETLHQELKERVVKAGLYIEEVRLSHLAYAPEIAQTMLRRQQAEAVIAARQKIVHGAVSMVEMALNELKEKKVLQLDDERKAAMVSNLLVVLCSESQTQPVVNAGTLYS